MAAVCFVIAGVFLLLAVHPFVFYPISLAVIGRFWRKPLRLDAGAMPETFSICTCVYNEEKVIRRKAENLLALRRVLGNLQILVYIDGASDGTAEILKSFEPGITVVASSERHGKTHGMNRLVERATGSVVIFSDADVIFEKPEAIANLHRYFADPAVGCVCGSFSSDVAEVSATAEVGSLYWSLKHWIKQQEAEVGSTMGADGAIFAIRRHLHRPPPDHIIDDMYVSLNVLCDGYRVVRAPEIVASGKSSGSAMEEFARKIRIGCQSVNAHRVLWPRLARLPALEMYKYVSHKLLRWACLADLVAASLAFEAGAIAAGWPAVALAFPALVAASLVLGWRWRLAPFSQINAVLMGLLGTTLGVVRALQGAKYQTWSPPQSVRNAE